MHRLIALAVAGIAVCSSAFVPTPALARDDGRFANSQLKPWFDKLASGKGLCCSFADGVKVEDVDWDTQNGRYRVRLNGQWIIVPDNAGDRAEQIRPGSGVAVSGRHRCDPDPLLHSRIGRLKFLRSGLQRKRGGGGNPSDAVRIDGPRGRGATRLAACVAAGKRQATSRENTSGSTLPPDNTATATLPLTSILPLSKAASATAPPGSTTSLSSANANATAAATSSSLAETPAPTSERLMAKVSLPGVRAISASQMVPVSAAFSSRSPLLNERA